MPSVTIWDRIEPRSRANDPTPGLEARVHDPLWQLARQWQLGEFEGRDAGSPVVANVQYKVSGIDRFSIAGQVPQAYDGAAPIETLVEREVVRPANAAADLWQAVEAGLYFQRLLEAEQLPAAIGDLYLAHYAITVGAGGRSDVAALAPLITGRVIDGVKLKADLVAAGASLPATPAVPQAQQEPVLGATRNFLAWYGSMISEPAAQAAGWSGDRMEYGFSMAVAGDTASYVAQEYDGGSIDWHTFDRSTVKLAGGSGTVSTVQKTVVATPVTFRGMPARRFWEFEDANTNIALISAAAEDLGRLLLREFALIYGNDWFQFPLVVPVGSLVTVTSLAVSDTFGVATTVPHYTAIDGAFARWHVFRIGADPLSPPVLQNSTPPQSLLIAPSAVAPLDSGAIEDVLLLRDELANVVWGIERTVVGDSGQALDRTLEWKTSAPTSDPPSGDPVPQYRLGSTVPDYWLPFLPVRLDAAGHLLLRRGRLPGAPSGPEGRMMAEASSIFLEEVPREGVQLTRRYRWARAADGSSVLWVGRLRRTGRGEGRSGLRFDYLE